MRVMGLDPGTIIAGWGFVDKQPSRLVHVDNGLAMAGSARDPLPARLVAIHAALLEVIERYQPDVVAVEEVFFNKNVQSALQLGHGRGVALLAAAQRSVPVVSYAPAMIKRAVTGSGRADKHQVQMMVKALLGLREVAAEDASDALAAAICHCHHGVQEALRDSAATRRRR